MYVNVWEVSVITDFLLCKYLWIVFQENSYQIDNAVTGTMVNMKRVCLSVCPDSIRITIAMGTSRYVSKCVRTCS